MTDEQLVLQLKKKNEKAFAELIERYSGYVSTVVRNIVSDKMSESDVEEITADVFITVWKNKDRLRPETLKAYLAAIARSLSIDRLRRLHLTLPIDELVLDDDTDVEHSIEQRILAEAIGEALNEMEPRDKELLLRYYYFCQKISRIAAEMKLSEAACKTALHRARKKLKEKLTERGYKHEV